MVRLITALVFGFLGGMYIQGLRSDKAIHTLKMEYAEERKQQSELASLVLEDELLETQKLQVQLNLLDESKTKEIEDAKTEIAKYRTCVANSTCGVRYVTQYKYLPTASDSARSEDASSSSLEHAASEIPRDVQQDLLNLREQLVVEKAQVEYLQEYALTCSKE